ncbi:unnamed protein product, partial [marine sediment metagenome]
MMSMLTHYLLDQLFMLVKNTPGNDLDVSMLLGSIESYNSTARANGEQSFSRANHEMIKRNNLYDDFIGSCFKLEENNYLFYRLVYAIEDLGKVVGLHVIHLEITKGKNIP